MNPGARGPAVRRRRAGGALALGLWLVAAAARADAPAEDPIVVPPTARVPTQLLGSPAPRGAAGADRVSSGGMPVGTEARVLRIEARARTLEEPALAAASPVQQGVTRESVVQQSIASGARQVCVTQIGTSTPTDSTAGGDQIVVVRGTVINICR